MNFFQIQSRYCPLLKKAGWHADPHEMSKAPSIAKGTPGRSVCEGLASRGEDLRQVIDEFVLAARLGHLTGIISVLKPLELLGREISLSGGLDLRSYCDYPEPSCLGEGRGLPIVKLAGTAVRLCGGDARVGFGDFFAQLDGTLVPPFNGAGGH